MKLSPYIAFLLLCLMVNSLSAQRRCDFDQYYAELLKDERFIPSRINADDRMSIEKSETVFLIPVVVHVIYKNSNENISLDQIQSQIEVLNQDFRMRNADTINVESDFSKADSRIEFCLAKRDPQGNETSGVTRTATNLDNIGTNDQYFVIQPAWDPDHYLNIWVGDYGTDGSGNEILGRASPPNNPNPNRDGVIITSLAFGSRGMVSSPYDRGRTTTHEVGHWLGLFHPWGENFTSCQDDDGIADTPNQGVEYYGCPNPPQISCNSKDMISNYMGYADDACMGNFTEGQKERLRSTLVLKRPTLLLSRGCLPVGLVENSGKDKLAIYPSPANDHITLEWSENQEPDEIMLFDLHGRLVRIIKVQRDDKPRQMRLNVADLNSGLYLLKLIGKNPLEGKIIIQH